MTILITSYNFHLGVACELVTRHLQRDNQHMSRLLHNLESQLKHEFDQSDGQIVFNSKFFRHDGSPVPRWAMGTLLTLLSLLDLSV